MKILAIYGSSRKNRNTDKFLDIFLKKFNYENEDINKIILEDLKFSHCISCYGCARVGKCVLKDDLTDIYSLIEESDIIVFSSPVYFNSVSAISKAFIDRMQVYWSRKFLLKVDGPKEKFGIALINGGSSTEKHQFLGSELVFDHFFKSTSCKKNLILEVSETDKYPINEDNKSFMEFLDSIEINKNEKEIYRLKEGKIEKCKLIE